MSYDPYDPQVPQFPTDSLETSQPELLNNFKTLYDIFFKNHVALDAASDKGNHTIVQLIEQINPLQTDVSEISVYTKKIEGSTDQVFLRYQGNGQEFAYTCYQIYGLTPLPNQIPYFTFLPGSILVYFGTFIKTAITDQVLTLYPPIAKNIMALSFCPLPSASPLTNVKPRVTFQKTDTGFITGINVTNSFPPATSPPSYYYIILANI